MPKLIEDVVEVKPDDVEVLEPIDELEWVKDEMPLSNKRGAYYHDHFCIIPSGNKFILEVTEPSTGKGRKGKVGKTTQVCKGPLKVCKGFALDISEGRLVKLESGNYGAPAETPPPLKTPEEIIKETDEALKSTGISVTDPCGNEIKPTDPDYAAAIPVAISVLGLSQAIAILSRDYPISALPPGSHFSQGGRFGTLIEMIGLDAKVEWEGKTTQWSGASPVKWAAERPGGEVVKKPSSPRTPLPTREEVKQQEEIKQANQAAQNIQAPSLQAESIF